MNFLKWGLTSGMYNQWGNGLYMLQIWVSIHKLWRLVIWWNQASACSVRVAKWNITWSLHDTPFVLLSDKLGEMEELHSELPIPPDMSCTRLMALCTNVPLQCIISGGPCPERVRCQLVIISLVFWIEAPNSVNVAIIADNSFAFSWDGSFRWYVSSSSSTSTFPFSRLAKCCSVTSDSSANEASSWSRASCPFITSCESSTFFFRMVSGVSMLVLPFWR